MFTNFKWIIENLTSILIMATASLMGAGFFIEFVARLIPTKTPDSVFTRIGLSMGRFGASLVAVGKLFETLLNFIKVPNNIKK